MSKTNLTTLNKVSLLAYLIKNNSELLPILLKVIETRIDKYCVSVKDDDEQYATGG